MKDESKATEGGLLEPAAAIVVYHRETGAIFATHHFSVASGAELPDRHELERLALETAAGDGCEAERHAVLHVEPKALRRGMGYRVLEGALVEVERDGLAAEVLSRG